MSSLAMASVWFLICVTYSVVGWCMEVAHDIIFCRKFVNRGFLIGPICPVYGFGTLIMMIILGPTENIFEIFAVAVVAGTILEYVTSYVMEKLFHVRWWDYSHEPFNVNGRVSLRNSTLFGIYGVILIRFVNPILFGVFMSIPDQLIITLAGIVLLVLIIDMAISLWLIIGCRVTAGIASADATDEISANVKELLMNKGKLNRRLAKAFPNMKAKKKTPRKTRKSSNK